uniref:Putative AMMECR1 n=1 Tax=uncultured marine microorganism HF4000_ANIW141A21 TaxID=455535 RepID=B3T560_9ZZZZ|nr:putative AMMECR1 [uncultured marine microorganism HF4000_ANIW141A21]
MNRDSMGLSNRYGPFLVQVAKRAIEKYVKFGERDKLLDNLPSHLMLKRGVFVTINMILNGEKIPRGCIGYPIPTLPLVESVRDLAIKAASEDPRFPSLAPEELDRIQIEVSVLSLPKMIKVEKPIEYPNKVQVGRDGLILEWGGGSGLILPQVAEEQGWDSEEFLCNLCMKAGAPPDKWLSPEVKMYKFSSQVYSE